MLIVGGNDGENDLKTSELFPQKPTCTSNVPNLPERISSQPSLILTQDQKLLLCGGSKNEQTCLVLKDNTWRNHSRLNQKRTYASAVTMEKGVFLFGGRKSPNTWEWLPNGSSNWIPGPDRIQNPGYHSGCAVKLSGSNVALIGGGSSKSEGKKLLTYNTDTGEWTPYENVLSQGRRDFGCALYKEKIIIAGGFDGESQIGSTELIDIRDLSKSTSAGYLNKDRSLHGIVVAHHASKLQVMAFGGYNYIAVKKNSKWVDEIVYYDSVEIWNDAKGIWERSKDTLKIRRDNFGYLSIPTELVCS